MAVDMWRLAKRFDLDEKKPILKQVAGAIRRWVEPAYDKGLVAHVPHKPIENATPFQLLQQYGEDFTNEGKAIGSEATEKAGKILIDYAQQFASHKNFDQPLAELPEDTPSGRLRRLDPFEEKVIRTELAKLAPEVAENQPDRRFPSEAAWIADSLTDITDIKLSPNAISAQYKKLRENNQYLPESRRGKGAWMTARQQERIFGLSEMEEHVYELMKQGKSPHQIQQTLGFNNVWQAINAMSRVKAKVPKDTI